MRELTVREANKTQDDFNIIIAMAKRHPYPEYDCLFPEWTEAFGRMFPTPGVRAWIAFDEETPVGYVVGIRERVFRNQITVFDIYLEPEYRGYNLIVLLISELRDWARADNAKRIQWTSKFNAEKWQRILDNALHGVKVNEYKTLSWEVI